MKKTELAVKIGVNDRTIRRWSKEKQQQWVALASEIGCDYQPEFFTELNKLAFEVAAFNAYNWQNGKKHIGANLSISTVISFGVYDLSSIPGVAMTQPLTLRSYFDVKQALEALEGLK